MSFGQQLYQGFRQQLGANDAAQSGESDATEMVVNLNYLWSSKTTSDLQICINLAKYGRDCNTRSLTLTKRKTKKLKED